MAVNVRHVAMALLVAGVGLSACVRRGSEAKDLMYDRFLASRATVPYDRMAYVGSDSLWQDRTPYVYVLYADSVTCSSCLATHLSAWQVFDEQLSEVTDSCRLCLVIPGDTATLGTVHRVLFYTQYSPCLYVDTAGAFPRCNPLVDSLRLLRSFLMDRDGRVLLVGDPTRQDMLPGIREALGLVEDAP